MVNTKMHVKAPDRVYSSGLGSAKAFYGESLEDTLRQCRREGFRASFMPQLVDMRIEAPEDALVWDKAGYETLSLRVTNTTRQGSVVAVYAHIPNYCSHPKNVHKTEEPGLFGIDNGAGIMPEREFYDLLERRDNENVFVVEYKHPSRVKWLSCRVLKLKKALDDPEVIAILGGRERTENYLDAHRRIHGEKIGVFLKHDISGTVPLWRPLHFGSFYSSEDGAVSSIGDYRVGGYARIIGLRNENPQQGEAPGGLENTAVSPWG